MTEILTYWWAAILETGAAFMLRWSWQALLLLGGAWLAAKCYRSKAPALRHQLWLYALMAVTILPFWIIVTHWVAVPQPTSKAIVYFVEIPTAILEPASEPQARAEPDTTRVDAPAAPFYGWKLLITAWIIGSVIALGRLLISYLRLSRARMKSQPISLKALGCENLNVGRSTVAGIAIKISPDVHSPILTGVFRPIILLPADIVAWTTAEERGAMLQHELAHFQRRDHYGNCFQSWLAAIFYFHPLVRYACRQLHLEREMACDDTVLSLGTNAADYAESLLKVAERNLVPVGLHQPAFFESKKNFKRRIEMIMHEHRPPGGTKRWPWLAPPVILLSAMIWLLVPLAGESMNRSDHVLPFVDAQDQPPPPPPRPVRMSGGMPAGVSGRVPGPPLPRATRVVPKPRRDAPPAPPQLIRRDGTY